MEEIITTTEKSKKESSISVKLKDILCPICGENARIKIDNFKLCLFLCKNGHEMKNLLLDEYYLSPKNPKTNIKCDKCKENYKDNTIENTYFFCLEKNCKINLCSSCKSNHDKTHKIINYEDKNYICNIHDESFISYCEEDQKDICLLCLKEHKDKKHNIIYYEQIIENKEEKLNELKELKNSICKLLQDVNDIINCLKKFSKYMKILYNINISIVNNFDIKKRNYITLKNFNEVNINDYLSYINPIINIL